MTNNTQMRIVIDDKGNEGPNVKLMQEELNNASTQAIDRIEEMQRAEATRYNEWENQERSGRKPKLVGGRPAVPWEGASDVRIPLADEIIRDQVTLMKTAARRAKLTIRGTEGSDFRNAGKAQLYMDWLRFSKMRANVNHEVELAANWRQTYGRSVMSVTWKQKWARDYETITLAWLQQVANENPQSPVGLMLAALYEPDRDVLKQLANQLVQLYPDLKLNEAYRQLDTLRKTGQMTMPVRYLQANHPQWKALKVWQDIFYPLNTEDLQTARWIAWRVTLTVDAVDEKKLSEGWSEDFAEAVKKTVGSSVLEDRLGTRSRAVYRDRQEQMDGLCEVFYFYYTHADEDGVPCKYRTVMSPHVAPIDGEVPVGPDEPVGFDHGLFPFVDLRAERKDREMEDARGVPEIASTAQSEVKTMRDTRVNQAELTLQPPMVRPEREIGLPLKIQPRGEIGEKRANLTRFFSVPNTSPAGEPLEMSARRDMDGYFARNRAEDPVRAGAYDQCLADDFCEEIASCWMMTLQEAQQFESEVEFNKKVGGKPTRFHVTRDEIQGMHDLQLYYNTDTLDPEKMKAKAEVFKNMILPISNGIINLAPIANGLTAYYFPEFADEALQGEEQAGEKEISAEQANWALIIAGEEPTMAEDGENFALRLQWLQNKLAQPGAQQRMQMLPDSKEMADRRLKHLEFMVQQHGENAQAGRVGVLPGQE
jgi:hypothetical protein